MEVATGSFSTALCFLSSVGKEGGGHSHAQNQPLKQHSEPEDGSGSREEHQEGQSSWPSRHKLGSDWPSGGSPGGDTKS